MELNNWQALCYYSWLHGTTKVEMYERLGTSLYEIKRYEEEYVNRKFVKKFGKDYRTPRPESPIGKLALWIYAHDMNWSEFGRTLSKCGEKRFKDFRWKGFVGIKPEYIEEIEEATQGFVKKEEWIL